MKPASARCLAIVIRSAAGQPRTFRLEPLPTSRNAAYRRLATAILRLDVATLGAELRSQRTMRELTHAA
jgi:hypothetical protein